MGHGRNEGGERGHLPTPAPQIELKKIFIHNYYWHFYNLILIFLLVLNLSYAHVYYLLYPYCKGATCQG